MIRSSFIALPYTGVSQGGLEGMVRIAAGMSQNLYALLSSRFAGERGSVCLELDGGGQYT